VVHRKKKRQFHYGYTLVTFGYINQHNKQDLCLFQTTISI